MATIYSESRFQFPFLQKYRESFKTTLKLSASANTRHRYYITEGQNQDVI